MAGRIDGRAWNALRALSIEANVSPYAEGSARVCLGNTQLLITASVQREIPRWMTPGSGGWITAEYGMLPRSTHTRNRREAASGKQTGRTLEIQRLIGRALRQAIDIRQLGSVTIQLDCDVLVADGGTRTAAIFGGWVALAQSLSWCEQQGLIPSGLRPSPIAAISLGKVGGELLVDLCYEEDSQAEFDLNIVVNGAGKLIEIQGTAERAPLEEAELAALLKLGQQALPQIFEVQQQALRQL